MKVGIVGAGKIAERHIAAFRKIGIDLTVTDINNDTAKRVSEQFNINVTDNVEDIINDKEIQIIDVCTPVTSHKDIILKSLKNKKHVFCEKPLCINLHEAYQIKGAAENAEKTLMVGYLYRFHPAFIKVKEWLDEGLIGKTHFGIFRIGGRGGHQAWKHSLGGGGGAINEMLIHKLDLVLWYMGNPKKVRRLSDEVLLKKREIKGNPVMADAEDMILIELQYDGAEILCEADLVSPVYMEYIEIHGNNGSIFASILNYFSTILFLKEEKGIYNQGNNFFNFAQVNLFELEIGHFLDCIKNGKRNMNSIDDSIEMLKIVERIREERHDSNRKG
jgi:predicted dehydrogenase